MQYKIYAIQITKFNFPKHDGNAELVFTYIQLLIKLSNQFLVSIPHMINTFMSCYATINYDTSSMPHTLKKHCTIHFSFDPD